MVTILYSMLHILGACLSHVLENEQQLADIQQPGFRFATGGIMVKAINWRAFCLWYETNLYNEEKTLKHKATALQWFIVV